MLLLDSQLQEPLDAIIFDCDGTLSHVEGINWLAEANNVGAPVCALTEKAMSHSGIYPALYQERLSLVSPNSSLVQALANAYFQARSPDVDILLGILKRLGKALYVVSAGVNPAVALFAERLGFQSTHIFAVNLTFDASGDYADFDHHSPMTDTQGKREIVTMIKQAHARVALVGDGMNDAVVKPLVTRFIGYGGAFYREKVCSVSDYYLKMASFLPLLPLLLTEQEAQGLALKDQDAYEKGLQLIQQYHQTSSGESSCK